MARIAYRLQTIKYEPDYIKAGYTKEEADKLTEAIKEAYDTSVSNNPPIRDLLELL